MDPRVEHLAEDAAARFLRYVRIDTQSAEDADTYPSTAKQLELLRLLRDELAELGLEVELDEHGYVFATVPATVDRAVPAIGFLAHVDTSPAVSGTNVKPQRIRYEGGEIVLPGDPSQVIRPEDSDELARHVGHELITTDGTTLLGADDKAGVAEIMAAVAYLVAHPEVPHGTLRIGFNPDEEVGAGTSHFDIERFDADCAYTLDGSIAGEIQDETFSAARVTMTIRGRSIHPGTAKGSLVNAVKLLARVIDRLPQGSLSPETTEEREGFVHPNEVSGDASALEIRFIARDFDDAELERHVELLRGIAAEVVAAEPRASIEVATRIQYRNMRNALARRPEIVANAEDALRRVGLEPIRKPIRGGTDGSRLTEKGLLTPNLFTGGQLAHSEREWICVEDMGLAALTVIELAKVWAGE
ncbi:MAG TPA: peptidase T [Gaiellaceae bacterium]|jgi:tripeptide aminopeptidase|nr:peptidase T [Gaiellaceae bacterium]